MITADDIRDLALPIITSSVSGEEFFARIVNLLLIIAGVIAFLYLIYAGILYIVSGSNPDQAKKAQQGFINVIIGIIIIAISYIIIRVVINLAIRLTQ